jgi:hypothetical protein
MGYTTDFEGSFKISPAIKPEHEKYINTFSDTRRMARDAATTEKLEDPIRAAVGLPVGPQGAFFVGGAGYAGSDKSSWFLIYDSVLDPNRPPEGQPGLWCQWVVEGGELCWDGGEKFYEYVRWLKYLIENFFKPWGYTLDGEVEWFGEDRSDRGLINVTDNEVRVKVAKITYVDKE